MEQTESSEKSAYEIQMLENHSEHSKSFKLKTLVITIKW